MTVLGTPWGSNGLSLRVLGVSKVIDERCMLTVFPLKGRPLLFIVLLGPCVVELAPCLHEIFTLPTLFLFLLVGKVKWAVLVSKVLLQLILHVLIDMPEARAGEEYQAILRRRRYGGRLRHR